MLPLHFHSSGSFSLHVKGGALYQNIWVMTANQQINKVDWEHLAKVMIVVVPERVECICSHGGS